MGESPTVSIGITRHTPIGLLPSFQFLDHLGKSTRWDRTGHFIWGHARANSAQGAPGAHRDLLVFLSEWNDMALRLPDNGHVVKGIMQHHPLIRIESKKDHIWINRSLADRTIGDKMMTSFDDWQLYGFFGSDPCTVQETGDILVGHDLVKRLETMRHASHATIKMIIRFRRERAILRLDPEDTAGRHFPGASICARFRDLSLVEWDTCRGFLRKRYRNGRMG
jgi:hypothetical protein